MCARRGTNILCVCAEYMLSINEKRVYKRSYLSNFLTFFFIVLGAKPPKNKYKNYKELLLEKKEEKKKLADDMDFQELGKNKVGKSVTKTNALKKKRKPEGGLIDVYGVVKTAKIKR